MRSIGSTMLRHCRGQLAQVSHARTCRSMSRGECIAESIVPAVVGRRSRRRPKRHGPPIRWTSGSVGLRTTADAVCSRRLDRAPPNLRLPLAHLDKPLRCWIRVGSDRSHRRGSGIACDQLRAIASQQSLGDSASRPMSAYCPSGGWSLVPRPRCGGVRSVLRLIAGRGVVRIRGCAVARRRNTQMNWRWIWLASSTAKCPYCHPVTRSDCSAGVPGEERDAMRPFPYVGAVRDGAALRQALYDRCACVRSRCRWIAAREYRPT